MRLAFRRLFPFGVGVLGQASSHGIDRNFAVSATLVIIEGRSKKLRTTVIHETQVNPGEVAPSLGLPRA